ncbi:hypothetical protein AGMMS50255_9200 [Spirochaetia bacterium]|nr:hypothetical protein AGMMS50255_9200 [Spirochaetia bacterium]
MIAYDKFEKSLKHLVLQYQNYTGLEHRAELGELDREAVAESVIQRFEVCYDCLWKLLKRYFETLELAGSFINDAAALYQKMIGEPWSAAK